jgi:hypothetical protein
MEAEVEKFLGEVAESIALLNKSVLVDLDTSLVRQLTESLRASGGGKSKEASPVTTSHAAAPEISE